MGHAGRLVFPILFVLALLPPAAGRAQPDGALQPGELLDSASWKRAEGLLPPEILQHFERGEYVNPIVAWPSGLQRWGEDFLAGTEENRGRFAVDERGTIVERATGRQPSYVVGFPFPDIAASDPRAAVKTIWNYFHQYWYNGNTHHLVPVDWVGSQGLEREVVQEVYFLYYDGQPRALAPVANPDNLLEQFLATAVSPADMYGTTALTWRYRDAGKRDGLWAYVPALRRVRQVSPSNRSDGFLGSDMSQDDGPFFDGKPEDFAWKLVGEADALRFADPYSLRGEVDVRPLPGGGWRLRRRDDAFAGFQVAGWKGAPWAPVGLVLARRPHWIIEATPKDSYYLHGGLQLYVDKETFNGSWSRKFDWQGQLANVLLGSITINHSPDGRSYFMANPVAVIVAENIKLGRATIASQPPKGVKDPPYDFRMPLEPAFFDSQTLTRFGK